MALHASYVREWRSRAETGVKIALFRKARRLEDFIAQIRYNYVYYSNLHNLDRLAIQMQTLSTSTLARIMDAHLLPHFTTTFVLFFPLSPQLLAARFLRGARCPHYHIALRCVVERPPPAQTLISVALLFFFYSSPPFEKFQERSLPFHLYSPLATDFLSQRRDDGRD
jgi:hypothetical protein